MNKKVFTCLMILLLSAFIISSCKVTQTYQPPAISIAGLYRDSASSDTNSIGNFKWNEVFTDTILQRLIGEGIRNNLDVQLAYTRVQQAEAFYSQSTAAFLPTLNANAGVTRSKFSAGQGFGARPSITSHQLGVSTSWEADIWGRLRSSRRANLANLLQSEAGARAVQTGVVSTIANLYFTLLALDQQLLITQQTVSNWDTTVTTMRALKEAARVTKAAVVQSEAQRYAAEVTIPDLKQSIRENENALSIVLGNAPAGISRGNFLEQGTLPMMNTGVPAQLLANRPDVQQAELSYRNAFELTNAARAAFYPALVITGNAGFASLTLSDVVNPSSIAASIGAGLAQPIFNRRLNRTNLHIARREQEVSILNFQNTLLNAGREVSNAISLNQTALEKVSIRTNQITALQLSVEYSQELLRNGFANYTEVIQARQLLLQAELGRVNDRLQQFQAVVDLYRALGGGWK